MPLYLGSTPATVLYLGAVPVTQVAVGGSPALGAGFSPSTLSGLITWYDASDAATLTVVGSAVSQMNDKSGNARHLTQATGANQPTIAAALLPPSGRDSLAFAGGTAQYLFTDTASISITDYTFFCVGRMNSAIPSGGKLVSWAKAGSQDAIANGTVPHVRNAALTQIGTVGGTSNASSTLVFDQWFVHTGIRLAAEVRSCANGGTDTVVTAGVTVPTGPYTRICIGTGLTTTLPSTVTFWTGGFGEHFCYNRLLTTLEKQQCEGYAAWKWGTQALLPAGHPYKASPP